MMRQIPVCDVMGTLQRYEAHVERGLYKALHELQRLQAARQGQAMAVPVAVDVTIDRAADGTAPAVESVELPNKAIQGDEATTDGSGTVGVSEPCDAATESSPVSMNGSRCDTGLPQRTGITEQSHFHEGMRVMPKSAGQGSGQGSLHRVGSQAGGAPADGGSPTARRVGWWV